MIRNHITRIVGADAVAKQTEEGEKKATGDLKKSDPANAEKAIADNTVEPTDAEKERPNPNTQLDSFEKLVREGVVEDTEQKKQSENERGEGENTDEAGEDGLVVSHPADSEAAGGEEVETDVDPEATEKKKTSKKKAAQRKQSE